MSSSFDGVWDWPAAPHSGSQFLDYSEHSNLLFTSVFLSLRAEPFLGEEETLECASHEQVVDTILGVPDWKLC